VFASKFKDLSCEAFEQFGKTFVVARAKTDRSGLGAKKYGLWVALFSNILGVPFLSGIRGASC